jgi:hypothetical protein
MWDTPCCPPHTWTPTFRGGPCKVPPCTGCRKTAVLGPPHSHALYGAPTSRSGVTSAPVLPRLARLLVSPRVKANDAGYSCHAERVMGLLLGACLMSPSWSPWYGGPPDPGRGHSREKIAAHVTML